MSSYHVLPMRDVIVHDSDGQPCVCGPTTSYVPQPDGSNGWLITHHSLDGREKNEA